jgi:hypothetical protein
MVCSFLIVCSAKNEVQAQKKLPAGWKKEFPTECNCTVIMPGEIKREQKIVQTELGAIKQVSCVSTGANKDPNYLYLLSWVEYPDLIIPSDSVHLLQDFYAESLDSHLAQVAGNLVYQTSFALAEVSGVLFRAAIPAKNTVIKGKMLLRGKRFYMWQVYCQSEQDMNRAMDLFLDSFQFTPE